MADVVRVSTLAANYQSWPPRSLLQYAGGLLLPTLHLIINDKRVLSNKRVGWTKTSKISNNTPDLLNKI